MERISINIELTQEDFESKEQMDWLTKQASYTNEFYKETIVRQLNTRYFIYQANNAKSHTLKSVDNKNNKASHSIEGTTPITVRDVAGILALSEETKEEIKKEIEKGKTLEEIYKEELSLHFQDRDE